MDQVIQVGGEQRIEVLTRLWLQAAQEAALWEAAYRTLAAQQDKERADAPGQ